LGRVFGAFLAFAQAAIPIGAAAAGVVIEGAGLIRTIAVGGAVYVIVVALMFLNPALRRMDARVEAAKEPIELAHAHRSPQARRSATMKAGL
jgi:hypothetical protein